MEKHFNFLYGTWFNFFFLHMGLYLCLSSTDCTDTLDVWLGSTTQGVNVFFELKISFLHLNNTDLLSLLSVTILISSDLAEDKVFRLFEGGTIQHTLTYHCIGDLEAQASQVNFENNARFSSSNDHEVTATQLGGLKNSFFLALIWDKTCHYFFDRTYFSRSRLQSFQQKPFSVLTKGCQSNHRDAAKYL